MLKRCQYYNFQTPNLNLIHEILRIVYKENHYIQTVKEILKVYINFKLDKSFRPRTGSTKPTKSLLEKAVKIEKISNFFTSNLKIQQSQTNDYFNNYIDSKFNKSNTFKKFLDIKSLKNLHYLNKNSCSSDNNSNLNAIIANEIIVFIFNLKDNKKYINEFSDLMNVNNYKQYIFSNLA